MAFFGGKLFSLVALAGATGFDFQQSPDNVPYGNGYRRIVTQDEKGVQHVCLQRVRYGQFIPNRGTIRKKG